MNQILEQYFGHCAGGFVIPAGLETHTVVSYTGDCVAGANLVPQHMSDFALVDFNKPLFVKRVGQKYELLDSKATNVLAQLGGVKQTLGLTPPPLGQWCCKCG